MTRAPYVVWGFLVTERADLARVPASLEDGTVKVLLGRQWAQIERAEVTVREFTVWWEMSAKKVDLSPEEVDSLVDEFRNSVEDKVRDIMQQV